MIERKTVNRRFLFALNSFVLASFLAKLKNQKCFSLKMLILLIHSNK
jgi:hypothetical protein